MKTSWPRGFLVCLEPGASQSPCQPRWPRQDRSQGRRLLSLQVWLFHQKPESLNPLTKYLSATTGFGSSYVTTQKVNVFAPPHGCSLAPYPGPAVPRPHTGWSRFRLRLGLGCLLSPYAALTFLFQLIGFSCFMLQVSACILASVTLYLRSVPP